MDSELRAALDRAQQQPIRDNVTAKQRRAVQSLRNNPDLVICESDKNQGLVAMDAADYAALGERCLSASIVEKIRYLPIQIATVLCQKKHFLAKQWIWSDRHGTPLTGLGSGTGSGSHSMYTAVIVTKSVK